ncbi:MAG: tRNA pseudouridine(38-40) synthase TruA [Rhabdochlamydiaceae bacterium]|nr:tRNA pseudouridine(38-40) synthase TruA [Candidatus Amphrikana amoebophyrae]
MIRYKLITVFDGTNYSGWQVQPNNNTIQAELQKAFAIALNQKVHVTGCGRTDAGVHAKGHVSHVTLDEKVDSGKLLYKLAGLLPSDIRVISLEEMSIDFHARYGAHSKTYHYHLHLSRHLSPFQRHYCHQVFADVDLDLMQKAASMFVGEHDFTSFAHQASQGCAKHAPVKTIYKSHFIEVEEGAIFEVQGSGFLHKMVRNMVGTLIDIGRGKIEFEKLSKIMEGKDRRLAGKTAPPQGLFLMEVQYGNPG